MVHIIVNNACQTVRRPPVYYRHLIECEVRPSAGDDALKPLLLQSFRPHGAPAALTDAGERQCSGRVSAWGEQW